MRKSQKKQQILLTIKYIIYSFLIFINYDNI